MNSDVNEDDEKILNPLKPQRNFGKNKKSHKKKLGSIASINVVKNNNGQPKSNPWFDKDKSKNNNLKKNNSYKTDEKSMINPLEQFDISNSNLGGLDISVNSNNVTMDKDTTFMKEIKSFVDKNKRNSYAANAQKRKSMKNVNKNNNANNTSNTSNTISYPNGVGNYSNKNKIINFDKKLANKGALPVIMKKENDKIINGNKQPTSGNNNDISGVDMIDQALKNFNMDNDESSILDTSNIKKWLK